MLADTQALAHVGSWEWDLAQPRAAWSDELCRIFGLAPGFSPTWDQFRALVHPEDREVMDAQVASVEDGREASQLVPNRPSRPARSATSTAAAMAGPTNGAT